MNSFAPNFASDSNVRVYYDEINNPLLLNKVGVLAIEINSRFWLPKSLAQYVASVLPAHQQCYESMRNLELFSLFLWAQDYQKGGLKTQLDGVVELLSNQRNRSDITQAIEKMSMLYPQLTLEKTTFVPHQLLNCNEQCVLFTISTQSPLIFSPQAAVFLQQKVYERAHVESTSIVRFMSSLIAVMPVLYVRPFSNQIQNFCAVQL